MNSFSLFISRLFISSRPIARNNSKTSLVYVEERESEENGQRTRRMQRIRMQRKKINMKNKKRNQNIILLPIGLNYFLDVKHPMFYITDMTFVLTRICRAELLVSCFRLITSSSQVN